MYLKKKKKVKKRRKKREEIGPNARLIYYRPHLNNYYFVKSLYKIEDVSGLTLKIFFIIGTPGSP